MSEHSQPIERSLIIMGVSGCGKSTVGKLLSEETGAAFFDGDDFHPAANIAKMKAGISLTDADRQGWLETLRDLLSEHDVPIIIACSALKQSYRDILDSGKNVPEYIYLHGSKETLLKRMQAREHFMPASLLDSQLSTLEEPTKNCLAVSIEPPINQVITEILSNII